MKILETDHLTLRQLSIDDATSSLHARSHHSSERFSDVKRGVDYIGVGVGAILVDAEGRLFLARRGPQAKNERGLWEFPGGSVEFGERLTEALQREIREEYGIEITVGELLDVVDHLIPEEGQHWVSPTFVCRITSGEPAIREPEKCTEIGWFSIEAMPAELTQITRLNLEHYRQRSIALSKNPRRKHTLEN